MNLMHIHNYLNNMHLKGLSLKNEVLYFPLMHIRMLFLPSTRSAHITKAVSSIASAVRYARI